MAIRRGVKVLGAALFLAGCAARVSSAQQEVREPPASETAISKEKISSDSDSPRKGVTVAKTSEGSQMGVWRRIADDQRRICTSPPRLRISDTEGLVPLSGITAGLFVTDRDFSKHLSQNPT